MTYVGTCFISFTYLVPCLIYHIHSQAQMIKCFCAFSEYMSSRGYSEPRPITHGYTRGSSEDESSDEEDEEEY
jgi:hypothetical protein